MGSRVVVEPLSVVRFNSQCSLLIRATNRMKMNGKEEPAMIIHWENEPMPEEDKDKGGKGGSK